MVEYWIPAAGWVVALFILWAYARLYGRFKAVKLERWRLAKALDGILGKPIPSSLRRKMRAEFLQKPEKGKTKKKRSGKNEPKS